MRTADSAWTGGANSEYGFGRETISGADANYRDSGLPGGNGPSVIALEMLEEIEWNSHLPADLAPFNRLARGDFDDNVIAFNCFGGNHKLGHICRGGNAHLCIAHRKSGIDLE